MNLTTFSTEQLHLFAHTLEGIYRQLDDISPSHHSEEDNERRETLMKQAFALGEQLDLEIARRSLLCIRAQVGGEESTTLELAHRQLINLQAH